MLSLDTTVYQKLQAESAIDSPPVIYNPTWYTQFGKRAFDIGVSLFVCVFILSWLVPVLSLYIRMTSPGPGLFVQLRTGRNGRIFRCFKFRTMYYETNPQFAQARLGDPRVTAIGAFLRRTNLDEMPQFLNVLFGDMSVVGPRPHAIQHDSQYWHQLTGYSRRYSVRPGITGLAQVRGARGEASALMQMRRRVHYDLHYIKRQSLPTDITLCWQTLKPMIKGKVTAW